MPYGVTKKLSPKRRKTVDKKIERCVSGMDDRGLSKQSKIAICKKSTQDKAMKNQRKSRT